MKVIKTLLLSRRFHFYAARRHIPTRHAVLSGYPAGSDTDERMTTNSQLHSCNENPTEACHPFGSLPYESVLWSFALIMLTRLKTLLFNWSLSYLNAGSRRTTYQLSRDVLEPSPRLL